MPKPTKAISLEQAQNIREGSDFAEQTGRPLNTAVAIQWTLADGGGDPRKRFARSQELIRHWFARKGRELTWVWAHEHGDGKGLHTHVLAHVPRGLGPDFQRFLERVVGPGLDGLLHVQPVRDGGALRYILKDLETADWADFDLPNHRSRHGRMLACKRSRRAIEGKRCGTSQNIGPTARARRMTPALPATMTPAPMTPVADAA